MVALAGGQVGAEVVELERRALGQRGLRVDHGRQRLVVDDHGVRGVLGLGDRLGHHGDDRFTDEADLAVGQRRPRHRPR